MAERHGEDPIAPRRSLSGPILPPPPPELAEEAKRKEAEEAKRREKQARAEAKKREAAERAARKEAQKKAQKQAHKQAQEARARQRAAKTTQQAPARTNREPARARPQTPVSSGPRSASPTWGAAPAATGASGAARDASTAPVRGPGAAAAKSTAVSRRRRARLRLAQVDAWSVMKTAFLLSIALGIVLVVAVLVIWSVLGSAGVWDSINSTVQQAVGSQQGSGFDIEDYLSTSRVVGFTMIVAVIDVILITAIATLGAFLYNLAAALLGGIEVTLTEER